MRITTLARRSVATVAATALLTTGLVGLSVGTAHAADQTVTSVSKDPAGPVINNATSTFKVAGSGFYQKTQMKVTLRPTFVAPGVGDIVGDVVDVTCPYTANNPALPIPPATECQGPVTFTANLVAAAPGHYDVVVQRNPNSTVPAGTGGTEETDYCYSCIQIFSAGPATVNSSAQNGSTLGALTITGSNFAKGAKLVWYSTDANGAPTVPDNTLQFSLASLTATNITGTYTPDPGSGGRKVLRVFNIDDAQTAGPGAPFVQPRFNSLVPNQLGQNANSIAMTVNGAGFDAGTTASWNDNNVNVAGPYVPAANGLSIVIPTSVADGAALGAKTLTLKGTGGAYTNASNVLTVNKQPKPTGVVPSQRGQNSTSTVTINGDGFTTGTVFNFGAGVTANTLPSTTATVAQVALTVATDAAPGPRDVRSTNPDNGTSLVTGLLNIIAKPIITTVTPPSGAKGRTVNVTLEGTSFSTGGVTLALSGTGITVGTTTVAPSGTSASTTFTIAPDAPSGTRDITITNNSSAGKSTCIGCFGVNSLSIDSPSGATNTGPKTLQFSGVGLDSTTVMTLSIPGAQTYQAPLTGTKVTCAVPAAGTVCATFDLENRVGHGVATGRYTATATTGSSVLNCTSCFPVVSTNAPTISGVSPAFGGQGAVDRTITITGTNFSPGENVTFDGTGITTSSVTWDSPTQIRAVYSITPTATTGGRVVRVTNIGDNNTGASAANAFTVNAGPTTTATSVASLGQNAVWDVALTGNNYAAGATANFGPGTSAVTKSVSSTSLVATVTVSDTADTSLVRDITVTNADGGSSVLANAFRVNAAPRITTITPGEAKAGETKTVTIAGSGFQPTAAQGVTTATTCPVPANGTCPTLTIAGLVATVKTVSADGSAMTAEFVINSNAPISNPAAKVTNADRGTSTKLAAFRIATVPVAPTNVNVPVARNNGVTVTWSFPTTANADGGSPLQGFVVDDGDATTSNSLVVGPAIRSADLTGLVNGKLYTFTVKAFNAIGTGAAGTKDARAGSQAPTSLTSTRSPHTSVAGNAVVYSGKLIRTSTGVPLAGARIRLTLTPDFGSVRGVTLATNSSGVWSYRFVAPLYNTTVRASFAGTSVDMPADAAVYRMGVAPRIVRRAPGSGSSSPAGTTISISGYVTPNKAGQLMYLREGITNLGTARVASDGTFLFRSRLNRGTYSLKLYMAATPGNVSGASPSFVLYRT